LVTSRLLRFFASKTASVALQEILIFEDDLASERSRARLFMSPEPSAMPRHFLRSAAALLAAAGLVASAAAAQASPLNIEIDSSTRIQLRAPAGSVIVANPKIADVTVVDANTLFITGKGYGVTEIVAVDAIGRPLFQSRVVVSAGSTGSVRVWRGAEATDMACGVSCSPIVRTPSAP